MYEFKVGDIVAVYYSSYREELPRLNQVAKVFKKYVVLVNDTKWDFHGAPYGRGKDTSTLAVSYIEPLTLEEATKLREKRALAAKQCKIMALVREWGKQSPSPEVVNAVYDLLFLKEQENPGL